MARKSEARQINPEAEEMAFGSESEKTQEQDVDLIVEKTDVGHDIGKMREVKAVDGSKREEIFVGQSESTQTYARIGADGETRLRAADPKESSARLDAAKSFNELAGSIDAMAKAILGTMPSLSAEARSASLRAIESNPLGLVSEALKSQKNPNEALGTLLRSKLEQHPEVRQASTEQSLLQLESTKRQATELARTAEKSGDEQAFKDAQADIYAAEKQISALQERLNPNASEAEKQVRADQVEGFVTILPEPVYEQGVGAVQARLKELEGIMSKADKGNDQLAWNTARNEYDRHRAIMPTLERVQNLQTIEAAAQKAMDDGVAKQLLERGKARARSRAKKSYWGKVADDTTYTLSQVTESMRSLEKLAAGGANVDSDYAKIDASRKELEAYLGQVKGQIESAQQENDRLKEAGIEINLEPDMKVVGATTELYMDLATMNRQNPELVATYVASALKSKSVSPAGLAIIKEFKADLEAGRLNVPERKPALADDEEEGLLDSRFGAGDDNEEEAGFAEPATMEATRQVKMKRGGLESASDMMARMAEAGAARDQAANKAAREGAADEPPPIPETHAREMDAITPADTADQTNFVREMPVVAPKSRHGAMEGFGEWAAGGEHPVARSEQAPEAQTAQESVRVNYDQFPTQQMDATHTEALRTELSQLEAAEKKSGWLYNGSPRQVIEERIENIKDTLRNAGDESEWWNQSGADQLSGAWAALDKSMGPDASKHSLLTMGVPKGILKKYPTAQALYKFIENPGVWARINGDAAATREALNRFVEEANNTRIHNTSDVSLAKKSQAEDRKIPHAGMDIPR
ncbi:MAG: hypothetical protein NTX72_05600 [Candidatus Uhrbacteria bacterium]|nr:hypothetical protein [Candidatus Uhrbacteria bacterium]